MTNTEIFAGANKIMPFVENMTALEYNRRFLLIRQLASPYKEKRPKRVVRKDTGDYFPFLVSEVLKTIRSNGQDYVFSESQVIDVIRYEPGARVEYLGDGIWEVSLSARQRTV